MGVLASLFAAMQATPAGWIADVILIGYGGWGVVDLIKTFIELDTNVKNARCEPDIDAAAKALASQLVKSAGEIAGGAGGFGALKAGGAFTRVGKGIRSLLEFAKRRLANNLIPFGFKNAEEFVQFGKNIRAGLSRAGYGNTEPILQGSAITGKSFKTGESFDVNRVSDFDIGLADSTLLNRAKELGIGLRSGGTRTGPLTQRDLRALGLLDVSTQMAQQAGREVNFMIYNSTATAIQKAPSIILP
jgi:filamentous hemagglutinin